MTSVVICTYNPKEAHLERAVRSILEQDCRRSEIEFFIVDNNSVNPVAALPVVRNNRIKVVKEVRPGLTAARECAVKHSRGDLVVFVDDDNVLDKSYVRNVKTIFSDKSIGVVSGNVVPEYETRREKWFYKFEGTLAIRILPSDRLYLTSVPSYSYYFPVGAGLCGRRSLLKDYFGSLDDNNRIEGRMGESLSSGEDIDIGFFAISRGYLVGASATLNLLHIIPAARTSVQYLQRLARASMHSSYLINRKWKSYFGSNVFQDFDKTRGQVMRNMILYVFLYPLKRFRVGYVYYRSLYHSLRTAPEPKTRSSRQ